MEGRGKFFVRRLVVGENVGLLLRFSGVFVGHRHPAVWMAAGVDFGERLDADVGENHRRFVGGLDRSAATCPDGVRFS